MKNETKFTAGTSHFPEKGCTVPLRIQGGFTSMGTVQGWSEYPPVWTGPRRYDAALRYCRTGMMKLPLLFLLPAY
jgi:hypothetical protein